ncbi:MAG: HTH-type transcriptional regulator SgrR [Thermoanaerobaculia bacterium]|nr:HTH-type transcriptional regulator SgrR [Thermoanaerobaculia bacterium]
MPAGRGPLAGRPRLGTAARTLKNPAKRFGAGVVAALAVLGTLVSACGGRAPGKETATVVILAERDVEGLDPHLAGHIRQTQSVLANMYEGLVTLGTQMEITPGLATSWTNPDELTWEFRLREDVVFHSGGKLTAGDVVYSLERARSHPKSTHREVLPNVVIEEATESSVRIRTPKPDAFLLSQLRSIAILSRDFVEKEGEAALESRSAGTGPFFLGTRTPGSSVELLRFEKYWRGPASIPRGLVLAKGFEDPHLATVVPEGAKVVFFARPGTDLFEKGQKIARPSVVPSLSVVYLGFDLRPRAAGGKENPFLDIRVRRAVSRALDWREIARDTTSGQGFRPTQMVSPLVFGFDPSIPAVDPDLREARALLSQTPWADGLEVELDVREIMSGYGAPISRSLQGLGWRVKVNTLPEDAFFDRIARGTAPLYVLRFSCRSGDAQELLDRWVHSRDAVRGFGSANNSYEKNPVPGLDAAIEEARRDLDPRSRKVKLQSAIRAVHEAVLAVPVYIEQQVAFIPPGLSWDARADSARLLYDAKLTDP